MKISLKILIGVVLLAGLVGCGGVSAPPVSLPAPVTGRIVVSSPDASGNISINGESGSVPGGSLVLAVNSSVSASNLPMKVLDLLVGNAYAADTMPSICSSAGHVCAYADSLGAFSIIIAGSINDEIIIVIIDPVSGKEISERLVRTVPENFFPTLTGPVDIFLLAENGYLLILYPGGTESINWIEKALLSPWTIDPTKIDVGGTGAHQLVMDSLGAVVSDIGSSANSIYFSEISPDGQTLLGFQQYLLPNDLVPGSYLAPADLLFTSLYSPPSYIDYVVMANYDAKPSVYFWDIANKGVQGNARFTIELPVGWTHKSTNAAFNGDFSFSNPVGGLQVVMPAFAFLSRFEKPDGGEAAVLSIYKATTLEAWHFDPVDFLAPDVYVELPAGTVAEDLVFVPDDSKILITDSGNDVAYLYHISLDTNSNIVIGIYETFSIPDLVDPGEIEYYKASTASDPIFFITAQNGTDENPDSVVTVVPVPATDPFSDFNYKTTSACLLPTKMAFDPVNEYLYVSCLTSKTIVKLPLSDLLP